MFGNDIITIETYVESSESNVLLVVEFPKGDQNNGE